MTDPRLVRAVVFPADPEVPVTAETVDCSESGLWSFLGGQADYLTLPGEAVLCFRGDGKTAQGVLPNPRATRFAEQHFPGFARHDMIMGSVLAFGFDETGSPADVSGDVERAALSR